MKIGQYSVYDRLAQIFSQPTNILNDDIAVRVMRDCVKDKTHDYGKNPLDYSLYRVGTFDNVTGEINSETTKVVDLITLVDEEEK